ncbi:hypothetical protein M426DRAFT_318327 [Hypoxylon sp. CI-4A]|nr:hypothetical protein M426DRAFT_318327 [Hypoxylon sp. CI-4A]
MHLPKAMLNLPPSLLVLLAAATQLRAQQQEHPTAIRKMTPEEGEKILPHYYAFEPAPQPQLEARGATDDEELSGNSTAVVPFEPPYPIHYDYVRPKPRRALEARREEEKESLYHRARDVLSKLRGRQFACPQDTHSCTNIDQPNYCCTDGTTCFVVTNAPDAGNVGCCPEGQNCGVTVGTCTDGSTACSAEQGGGCCISGFVCAEVGCISSTVSVITQTTITSTAIRTTPSPSTQVITVIVTVTPTDGGAPVTSTTTQTTTAAVEPSSASTATATSTTSEAASASSVTNSGGIPPYRPTSGSSLASSESYCPTGFYACSAGAGGGCCRTGRDCSTASCPPLTGSTTVESNGATVVVPLTDAVAAGTTTSTCASGWFMCGTEAGPVAGCCPTGYSCGTASCTIETSTATATVQKELPSSASRGMGEIVVSALGLVLGAGLFALGLA